VAGGPDDGAVPTPPDPITVVAEMANSLHEIFKTYVSAGFSEAQAIYLAACFMCGGPKQPPG
jgi:hypothetical protein